VQDKFLICLAQLDFSRRGKAPRHLTAKVVSTMTFQNKIKNLSCTHRERNYFFVFFRRKKNKSRCSFTFRVNAIKKNEFKQDYILILVKNKVQFRILNAKRI